MPRIQIDPSHNVSIEPVGWLNLIALVRPGHPLAGQAITEETLRDWPVIGVSSLDDADVSGHARVEATITCDSQEVLRRITLNSEAVWLTADCLAQRDLVQLHGLQQEDQIQIIAASPAGRTLSPAALTLIAASSAALASGI